MGIVAVGDNNVRMKIASWLVGRGRRLAVVVHPAAAVGRDIKSEKALSLWQAA